MRSKRIKIWISVISAMVILAILGTLIARIPPAFSQLPANTASIMVVLSHPVNGTTWPADTPIPVEVKVTAGAPIKSVEFWTDGRLFDTQIPPADRQIFYKVWFWMPLEEGTHAVFARATDVNGKVGDSNAVHVLASAAAGLLTVQTALGDETIQSLADQNGLTPEQIAAANPSLDPAGPVAPGTQIFIPGNPFSLPSINTPPDLSPEGGPVIAAEEGGPGGASFLIENILNRNTNAPTAPLLSASTKDCSVTLTIQDNSDNEDGFFVYSLPQTSVSFTRLTSLKSHTGTGSLQFTLQNQAGYLQFFVASYNSGGESASSPVAVNVTGSQCGPVQLVGLPGNLQFQNGSLTIMNKVQLAYLYFSINGCAWQRLPAGHEFWDPASGPVNLKAALDPLLAEHTPATLDMDVWGWSGDKLVHLGLLHDAANSPTLEICNLGAIVGCGGDQGDLQWRTDVVVDPDQADPTRKLNWTADGSDITYAIWQVSSKPFPAQYSVGAPPGLLISGISEATASMDGTFSYGSFIIDFKTDLQNTGNEALPLPTATLDNNSRRVEGFDSFGNSDLAGIFNAPFIFYQFDQTLYIRVMPIAGGHPATDPSNSVTVKLEPSVPNPPIHISKYPTYVIEILPETYVNEIKPILQQGILGCSVITAVDHDTFIDWFMQIFGKYSNYFNLPSLAEQNYQFYADRIGITVCPSLVTEDEPGILEQVGQAFLDMWSALASTIEQIKGELVNLIASLIPNCDATCKMVLMTGLNFAITFFTGLPPSLPTFGDMVDMGMEYAVQMAITQAGIPYCDPTCVETISDTVQDAATEVAKSGKTQPGCSSQDNTLWTTDGGHLKPLCFPPGVSFSPVKGSMYENGMVQVKVTRVDGVPGVAPIQKLVLDTSAVNNSFADGHSETDYFQMTTKHDCHYVQGYESCAMLTNTYYYDMVFNAPVTGIPYQQASMAVPGLKTGQSIVIPVVFGNGWVDHILPNVYQPRLDAILKTYPDIDVNSIPVNWNLDFNDLTGSGSQITIAAHMLCTDPADPSLNLQTSPCSEFYFSQVSIP